MIIKRKYKKINKERGLNKRISLLCRGYFISYNDNNGELLFRLHKQWQTNMVGVTQIAAETHTYIQETFTVIKGQPNVYNT